MKISETSDIYDHFVDTSLVPMTLRVGVAGHREHANIRSDNPELVNKIACLYRIIHSQLQRCSTHPYATSLYLACPPVLRLTSSLADGADRLLLEPDLVAQSFELACVLPFNANEYANDFNAQSQQVYFQLLDKAGYQSADSRVLELDGSRQKSDFAYRDCAETLVRNSDLLIALYDGKEKPGYGTAWTVNQALAQKIPVIWIDSEHPNEVHFIQPKNGSISQQQLTDAVLYEWLGHLLLFDTLLEQPQEGIQDIFTQHVLQRFAVFNQERCLTAAPEVTADFIESGPIALGSGRLNPLHHGFTLLKRLFTPSARIDEALSQQRHAVPEEAKLIKEPADTSYDKLTKANHGYFAAYLRADQLANYYSGLHRSTFVFIYLLGAGALMVAALAIALSNPSEYGNASLYCAAIEVALLGLIYVLFRRDRRRHFHDRWLEYRCIAEFLRPTMYLSLFGSHFPMRRFCDIEEVLGRNLLGHGQPERCWAYLYTETVLRWVGFSGYKIDNTYLQQALHDTRSQWISQQYRYHSRNAIAMNLLGRRLAKISERLFVATIVVVCIKVALGFLPARFYLASKACGVLAAWFPVLGTTSFAIRNHAEFEISAQRSLSAREILLGYNRRLIRLSQEPLRLKAVDELLRELTAATITETADWLEIYEVKETETV